MICRVCRQVRTLESCTIDEAAFLPAGHGFQDVTHRLEFFGTCPHCHKKATRASP
jgi:Fe2+ or Zn2+ uptake regulation protein